MLSELASKLAGFQSRLEAHFLALAAVRKAAGLSTFAIEHGLSADELSTVAAELKASLNVCGVFYKHWLLWVVYAAELGYDYDGLEYWPYLEAKTPGWRRDSGNRSRLKSYFLRFERDYAGFLPVGPWAEQFSIISRPIAHAILPRDLQQQLARLLWEQRYLVARFVGQPPAQVGAFLKAYSHGSSRLLNFLQNEELAGRVVLALLENDGTRTENFIAEGTFQRILKDLESTRNAARWLKDARTVVERARVRLEGPPRTTPDGSGRTTQSRGNGLAVVVPSIKPRLRLRNQADGTWMAILDLPSFEDVASLRPEVASFLKTTRFTIPAVGNTWYPRGSLLQAQRRKLTNWPAPGKSVIKLDAWSAEVNHLIQSECRISAATQWLFKIGSDGDAPEVLGGSVRPGEQYVLVRTSDAPADDGFSAFDKVNVDCGGVVAIAVHVPANASDELWKRLAAVGLSVERAVKVWPVGIPPVQWDGETSAEWFADDVVSLALRCEGRFRELVVKTNGKELRVAHPGEAVQFLTLGRLPEGVHSVCFAGEYDGLDGAGRLRSSGGKLEFNIRIRRRRGWTPGTSAHSGLIVNTVPHEPSLDAVLSGQAVAHVAGPAGRRVRCAVSLKTASDEQLGEVELGSPVLPVLASDWSAMLSEHGGRQLDPEILHQASAAYLVVDGGELGQAAVRLRHLVSPIRWQARGSKAIEIKVINDSATDSELGICYASFRAPTQFDSLTLGESWSPVSTPGLYVAASGADSGAIVVNPPVKLTSLSQLAERIELPGALNSGAQVIQLLEHIALWSRARTAGPLAQQKRQLAVQAMERQLAATMCGLDWVDAEAAFEVNRDASVLERGHERRLLSFAIAISKVSTQIYSDNVEDSRKALLGPALLYQICGDETLCEASLRLFGAPAEFHRHYGSKSLSLLDHLVKCRPLLRAARHAAILVGDRARQFALGWPHDFSH